MHHSLQRENASKTGGQPITPADFFGLWSFFASVEGPLFLVGRMVMTLSNALVSLQYVYF
jgi:hypothetical protein